MNILYVEDDLMVSEFSMAMFEKLDHTILWCQSIECAKKCLKAGGKFDLILLDMQLGYDHGTSLLRFLENTGSKIPVIIVSGYYETYAEEIEYFKKKGIVIAAYTKPLNFKGFAADIEALFAHA